jgi:hypothetical protein
MRDDVPAELRDADRLHGFLNVVGAGVLPAGEAAVAVGAERRRAKPRDV